MRRIKLLKNGNLSEESIHKTVMDWVFRHPHINKLVLHFPNEGKRTQSYGRLMNDLGMRKGTPDLFIMMARHGYHGAWIELKSKNGIVSSAQKDFMRDADLQNYFTQVCQSIEETINIINWYCFK